MGFTFLKKAAQPPISVKFMLHRQLAGTEEPRSHFPLRASDTTKKEAEFCPREHALLDLGAGAKKGQFIGTSLRYTFDHGRSTEERIRNEYLRSRAVGWWKCGVCSNVVKQLTKAPQYKCQNCGWGHLWTYQEVNMESAYSGINCHLDLLLETGRPKLRIVEVKSMAPDEFKTLAAPLGEHRQRTSLYLQLTDDSSWAPSERIDTTEASILYASKAFGIKDTSLKEEGIKDAAFSPFKEFLIKRNDTLSQTIVSKARMLKLWREDRSIGFPAGVCANGLSKRSLGCGACGACFSGKYQGNLTWMEAGAPRHAGKTVVQ